MDYRQTTENETPKKFLHDSNAENCSKNSIKALSSYESPFHHCLPKYSTPPSRFPKIKNPFEASLIERLHLPVFSPSVFNKTPPRSAEKFKWSIDDISVLRPADIDETTIHQVESPSNDPELELSAQERINKYFSEKHIVPSPMMMAMGTPVKLISSTPPRENRLLKSFFHNECQTELSLPPNLPPEVEEVLKPYLSYSEEDDANERLYKKLFERNVEVSFVSTSTAESSPVQPCNLSPVQFSPCDDQPRTFDSPKRFLGEGTEQQMMLRESSEDDRDSDLSGCNLSPIREEGSSWRESIRECRSAARLDYTERMSIDASIGMVPTNPYEESPITNNTTLFLAESESPVRELLSTSATIWDMEYNTVNIKLLDSPESVTMQMDISNTNTPKSKKMLSQRPKVLSDSFLFDSHDSDENEEKLGPIIEQRRKALRTNLLFKRNDDDNDGDDDEVSSVNNDEDSNSRHQQTNWFENAQHQHIDDNNLIASTPTKRH